jgi:hypothetical protein
MWCSRMVNLSPFLSCAALRTRSIPDDGAARSCARTPRGPAAFPLAPALGPRPWLRSLLTWSPRLVRRFRSYYGEVRPLVAVHHGLRPCGLPRADRRCAPPPASSEISRFPRKERPCMLGSLTTPGRIATCDNAAARIAFRFGNIVGTQDLALSRLDGQPARSPADASPCTSRDTAHGSGPVWIATPSPQRTCTSCSLPVSRRIYRPPSAGRPERPERRADTQPLLAAHERLWHLRHPETREAWD